MAARTKSKVSPKYKTKYRVRNWAAYEEALRERGDITVWFDEEASFAWNAPPSGRPGGQRGVVAWPEMSPSCPFGELALTPPPSPIPASQVQSPD